MPMINEAIEALREGVATREAIDGIMKLGMNHPMGPLTLADFIGLDTCLSILRVLQQGFGDPKYRPSPLLVQHGRRRLARQEVGPRLLRVPGLMYCQVCGLKNPDEEEFCARCNSKLLVLSGVGVVEEIGGAAGGDSRSTSTCSSGSRRSRTSSSARPRRSSRSSSRWATSRRTSSWRTRGSWPCRRRSSAAAPSAPRRSSTSGNPRWTSGCRPSRRRTASSSAATASSRASPGRTARGSCASCARRSSRSSRSTPTAGSACSRSSTGATAATSSSASTWPRRSSRPASSSGRRRYFKKILAVDPNHFEALVYSGIAASESGDTEAAEAALNRAVERKPDAFLPHFALGTLYAHLSRWEEAEKALVRALDGAPVPSAHILLGNVLREKGEISRAIHEFEEARRLAPESEEAVFQLGLCYLEKNWHKRALECFQQALEKNPRRLEYQEAVRLLERRQRLRAAARGRARRGGVQGRRGERRARVAARAQELYRKAMRAEPRNPTIRVSFALLSASIGRWKEAIAACREVLAADPEDVVAAAACSTLAEALRAEGRPREAARVRARVPGEASRPRRRRRSATTSSRRASPSRERTSTSRSTTRAARSRRRPRS